MVPSIRARQPVTILLLAAAVLFGLVTLSGAVGEAGELEPGGTFVDDDLNTHEAFIEAIAAIGVTSGCGYETYCPGDKVTRAQMASFLTRALDLPPASGDYFGDDNGSAHEDNINRVAEAGITLGCGNGNYCPNDNVGRDQMASFLARAFKLAAGSIDYFDDDNGSIHEDNINRVAEAGITLGCGGNNYCPTDPVGRDQMASFLGRGIPLDPIEPPYPTRTLVSRFYEWRPDRDDIRRYEVQGVVYSPRQMASGFQYTERSEDVITNAGVYAGWDVLMPDSRWSDRTDSNFFNFFLTRPARVALVWVEQYRDTPGWLNGWELSGTVAIDGDVANVYERTLGYGWQTLAGPAPNSSEGSRVPVILISEWTRTPTAAPPVPTGSTTPVANQLCPLWVHDANTTVAWDGETYGTWHPQIDPTYWCSYGHEHGSNPAQIPGAPFVGYQYVADKVPQDEPDMGFKETIFRTPEGYWVRFIDHSSTASGRRVCAQFHTMYSMVYSASGQELFRAGFKLDFGVAVDSDTKDPLNPSNCGYSLPALAPVTDFERRIRTTAGSNDYEQWRAGPTVEAANLGMVLNHEFDIRDPFTFCNSTICDSVNFHADDRNQTGTQRVADNTFRGNPMIYDARLSVSTGTYYTDPWGNPTLLPSSDDQATQQYIAAGFYLNLGSLPDDCVATEPWDMPYSCEEDLSVGKVNISDSLDPVGWLAVLAAEG